MVADDMSGSKNLDNVLYFGGKAYFNGNGLIGLNSSGISNMVNIHMKVTIENVNDTEIMRTSCGDGQSGTSLTLMVQSDKLLLMMSGPSSSVSVEFQVSI